MAHNSEQIRHNEQLLGMSPRGLAARNIFWHIIQPDQVIAEVDAQYKIALEAMVLPGDTMAANENLKAEILAQAQLDSEAHNRAEAVYTELLRLYTCRMNNEEALASNVFVTRRKESASNLVEMAKRNLIEGASCVLSTNSGTLTGLREDHSEMSNTVYALVNKPEDK